MFLGFTFKLASAAAVVIRYWKLCDFTNVQSPLTQFLQRKCFEKLRCLCARCPHVCPCTCTLFTCERKQQNNGVPVFSVWGEVWEPCFNVVQHTLSSCGQHTFYPQALAARGAATLTWPWLSCVFTVPPSLDVLLSLSLWQYVDKAVTDTSSQEGHSGSSSRCNAPPQFLINDKANPLAPLMASWTPEPPISVRKRANREEARSKGRGKNGEKKKKGRKWGEDTEIWKEERKRGERGKESQNGETDWKCEEKEFVWAAEVTLTV